MVQILPPAPEPAKWLLREVYECAASHLDDYVRTGAVIALYSEAQRPGSLTACLDMLTDSVYIPQIQWAQEVLEAYGTMIVEQAEADFARITSRSLPQPDRCTCPRGTRAHQPACPADAGTLSAPLMALAWSETP